MSENTHTHWTEDEDLLSEYALGRLPAEKVERLDAHLQTCAFCREAVRRERVLISGVRRHGREELKIRLGTAIRGQRVLAQTFLPWQRAVAVAAVVVTVLGVGLLEGWFGNSLHGVFSSRSGRPTGGETAFRSVDSSATHPEGMAKFNSEEGGKHAQAETQTAMGAPPQHASDRADKPRQIKKLKTESNSQSAAAPSELATVQKKAEALEKDSDHLSGEALSKGYDRELWAGGQMIRTTQTFRDDSQSDKKMLLGAEQANQQQGAGKTGNLSPKLDFASQKKFDFRQATTEMLPASRQGWEERQPLQIQTLFRRTRNGTDVTLFLDTLINEADLQSASVMRAAPDSIVIVLKSRLLGYRLPVDFLDSVMGAK